jgi:hypothetical protein
MSVRYHSNTADRLIRMLLEIAGPHSKLIDAHEREWASATFSGARHSITLDVPLTPADPPVALCSLPDHDFALRGEIVADCTVTFGQQRPDGNGGGRRDCLVELLTIAAD